MFWHLYQYIRLSNGWMNHAATIIQQIITPHDSSYPLWLLRSYKRSGIYIHSSDATRLTSGFSYNKKLDTTQQNYTTTKHGMLSISFTLEEFWSMLLDANIRRLTDQKIDIWCKTNNYLLYAHKVSRTILSIKLGKGMYNIICYACASNNPDEQ